MKVEWMSRRIRVWRVHYVTKETQFKCTELYGKCLKTGNRLWQSRSACTATLFFGLLFIIICICLCKNLVYISPLASDGLTRPLFSETSSSVFNIAVDGTSGLGWCFLSPERVKTHSRSLSFISQWKFNWKCNQCTFTSRIHFDLFYMTLTLRYI